MSNASTSEARTTRRLGLLVLIVGCVGFYGLAMVFLWRPIIGGIHNGLSVSNIMKNWYLGDQLTYLSITSNVKHGLPAYREPLMLDGSSIYPSGYYWLLGMIGRVTGLNPFALWNIVGAMMTMALMLVAGFWGFRMSGRSWGWIVGPLPVVVGTLEWWSSKGWMMQYGGVQAVQWPGYAILFNPGTEQFSLTACALILMATYFALRQHVTTSWKLLGIAGIGTGLILNTHSYIPLLTLITVPSMVLLTQAIANGTRTRWLFVLIGPAAGIGLAALHIPSMPLGRFVMVIAGLVAPLLVVKQWRVATFKAIFSYFALAAIFSLPLMLRILDAARDKSSFFYFRQHLYDGLDFNIPMRYVLKMGFPVLALGGLAIVFLWRRRNESRHIKIWIAAIAAVALMTSLMEWNAHWGFGQEPYRFFPYQMILLTIVAAPWLVSKVRGRLDVLARFAALVLLAATVPTTVKFYEATRGQLLHISNQEQALFQSVAEAMPSTGAVLTDSCIPRKVFKVVTHAPVADIVYGLALPNHAKALEPVMNAQMGGTLLETEALRAAGISSFLSMNYCNGPDFDELNSRFGQPIAVFRLADPAYCGLPSDTTYRLYGIPQTGNSAASEFRAINPKDRFASAYKSTESHPLPPAKSNCALTTY